MASTKVPQNKIEGYIKTNRSDFLERFHGIVWQDRSAPERARTAFNQASRAEDGTRSLGMGKKSDRTKKHFTSRKTLQAIGWVDKPISVLIDESAREWQVSRSKAIARLIELGLENKILSANTRLLSRIIRETVAEECRKFFGRLSSILFRMYVLLAQAVHLQRNLVSRSGFQKRLTPGQVEKIIAWSKTQARQDVIRRKGNADTALDQAVEAWLNDLDEKQGTGEHPQNN